jgi:hypothetical protein
MAVGTCIWRYGRGVVVSGAPSGGAQTSDRCQNEHQHKATCCGWTQPTRQKKSTVAELYECRIQQQVKCANNAPRTRWHGPGPARYRKHVVCEGSMCTRCQFGAPHCGNASCSAAGSPAGSVPRARLSDFSDPGARLLWELLRVHSRPAQSIAWYANLFGTDTWCMLAQAECQN